MAGRPTCVCPVLSMSREGSWLGMSVYIECTKHRSSAQAPRCGKSSLTGRPHCPYFRKAKGERIVITSTREIAAIGAQAEVLAAALNAIGVKAEVEWADSNPNMNDENTSRRYPMSRPLFLLTHGEPKDEAKIFVDFMLSPRGQALVRKHGYLELKQLAP